MIEFPLDPEYLINFLKSRYDYLEHPNEVIFYTELSDEFSDLVILKNVKYSEREVGQILGSLSIPLSEFGISVSIYEHIDSLISLSKLTPPYKKK